VVVEVIRETTELTVLVKLSDIDLPTDIKDDVLFFNLISITSCITSAICKELSVSNVIRGRIYKF